MSNFKKASKLKLRFPSTKGHVSVEDLWNLTLNELDAMYKALNKARKEDEGESLLATKSPASTIIDLQIELIKEVVKDKQEERDAAKLRMDRKKRRQELMELMLKKQAEADGGRSMEDLQKELSDLNDEE